MSKTTLYTIADEYKEILDSLEDGELDDTSRERLNRIEHALQDKATNIAAHIRNEEEMVSAMKNAEGTIAKRRRRKEREINWLRQYLKENMEATGIRKIECPWFGIVIRKNPAAVDVFDISRIPYDTVKFTIEVEGGEYARLLKSIPDLNHNVVNTKADRIELKKRLEKGEKIDGASLMQRTRIQIT